MPVTVTLGLILSSLPPPQLTPREFELAVKSILEGSGLGLQEFSARHLDAVSGVDGSYVIDVTVRFTALGANFLVLVECKHQSRKTEREDVQVLHDKLRSTGAQKAMLFATAGFQQGAIDYADVHGIALVQLASGESTWFTKSFGPPAPPPPSANISKFVGWWHHGNSRSVMAPDIGKYTRQALGAPNEL